MPTNNLRHHRRLPAANGLTQLAYPAVYEPTLTHRVTHHHQHQDPTVFDFVPAGNIAETCNIVNRDTCNKCHGTTTPHAG
jgi:hypothetical protein